jgi:hypothetical protein
MTYSPLNSIHKNKIVKFTLTDFIKKNCFKIFHFSSDNMSRQSGQSFLQCALEVTKKRPELSKDLANCLTAQVKEIHNFINQRCTTILPHVANSHLNVASGSAS